MCIIVRFNVPISPVTRIVLTKSFLSFSCIFCFLSLCKIKIKPCRVSRDKKAHFGAQNGPFFSKKLLIKFSLTYWPLLLYQIKIKFFERDPDPNSSIYHKMIFFFFWKTIIIVSMHLLSLFTVKT